MAQDSPPPTNGASNGRHNGSDERPPRLPRWTRQEILVLIQGKKVAESRVRRGRSASFGAPAATAVEPKWASVASYCRRHGVDRGPVQCRKRWSNLSGDFKKIKEWEARAALGDSRPSDSFWAMRADARREKKLPGFFDREVYDILDQGSVGPTKEGVESAAAAASMVVEEDEVIFDSGRAAAAEDGLFSDSEQPASPEKAAVAAENEDSPVTDATPISAWHTPIVRTRVSNQTSPLEDRWGDSGEIQGRFNLLFTPGIRVIQEGHHDSSLLENPYTPYQCMTNVDSTSYSILGSG
ncbi:hypothetical protein ACLOJK_019393 [Asimina triloba]